MSIINQLNQIKKDAGDALKKASKRIQSEIASFEDALKTIMLLDVHEHLTMFLTQIRWQRTASFVIITSLMFIETMFVFFLLFSASFEKFQLVKLDPITLRIVISATLTQVSVMMIVVIRSVFPPKLNDIIINPILEHFKVAKQIDI
jgi:hypothetical protein